MAVALAATLAACGEIREVPVDAGGAATGDETGDESDDAGETETPIPTTGTTGGSEGSTGDHETGSTDGSTGDVETEERIAFCTQTVAVATGTEVTMQVDVTEVAAASDPWVAVRGLRTAELPLRLSVEHVGVGSAVLVDADSCGPQFDLMFADGGGDVAAACVTDLEPTQPVAPQDALGPLLGAEGGNGTWLVTLDRSSRNESLEGACVSFAAPRPDR